MQFNIYFYSKKFYSKKSFYQIDVNNMAKKKEKKKPIFEKVGIVFRSPVRADIMRQLSEAPQRPNQMAEDIGIQKQNLNYHLNALKKGGLVKIHTEEVEESEVPSERGVRIDGRAESGKIQVSYGLELTKNGKDIVNQFLDDLYESEKDENNENMEED